MKSFGRNLSRSKKSLSEALTQKNLQTDVLNCFKQNSRIEVTAEKKELILVLPYLGQQSFEIQNRIQCCRKEDAPVFNL